MKINLKITALLLLACFTTAVASMPSYALGDTSTTTISVKVPELINIQAVNPGSGGTLVATGPTVKVTFTATGAGLVTITDQNGHVLYQYNKVSSDLETITTPVTIIGGAGDYKLTLSITNDSLGTASDFINVTYRPVGPGTPNTGFIKIGNQEYSVISVSALGVILVVLTIVAIIFKKRDHKQQHDQI